MFIFDIFLRCKDLVCSVVLFCSYSTDSVLQFFKVLNITADQKKFFRKAFHTYYDAAAELLQSEHSVRLLILLKLLPFFGWLGAELILFVLSCFRS